MPDESSTPPSFLAWVLKLAPGGVSSLVVFGVLTYLGWNTDQQVPWYAWPAAAGTFVIVRFIQKVWDKLEPDAVDGTVHFFRTFPGRIGGTIRGVVRRLTDRTESRYLTRLTNRFGLFNDKGLGLINANRLDLERVYVELRTAPDVNLSRAQVDPIARTTRGNRPFWDFLRAYRPGIGFAIVGPPGSGKTTLIHHVALTYSRRTHRRHKVLFRIPILIELRAIAGYIVEDSPTLAEVAERAVRELFPRTTDLPSTHWFEQNLATGRCALLFDGLDEIGDGDKRRTVSQWLDAQISSDVTRTNLFAVTSRPAGYKSSPLDRAQVLEVQPFTQEQSRTFIDNWYLANEIVSSGNQDNRVVRERAQPGADHLHRALRDNPKLNDLAGNPLLLTMMVMVHRYHGALPGSRGQLYAEVCQVLLERWRQARGVLEKHTGAQRLAVLKPLAAHMTETRIREIPEADALVVMSNDLKRIGVLKSVHPARANENLRASQFIFQAVPLPDPPEEVEPVTVICCVSDDQVLRANLLASPDLQSGGLHEVLLARDCRSAAEGLNAGIERAQNRLVVAVHQDVYLPRGWFARATRAFRQAAVTYGPIGVAGVYGVAGRGPTATRVGRVVDRDHLLWERSSLPAVVSTLDELVLVVERDAGLRFDPALGFHLYAADICHAARRVGLAPTVIDAVCLHNSQTMQLPFSFQAIADAFARKWAGELPISTPSAHIEPGGHAQVW